MISISWYKTDLFLKGTSSPVLLPQFVGFSSFRLWHQWRPLCVLSNRNAGGKKRPQRIEPNDSRNWRSSKDPSGKNPSSFVQPIQNIVESESVLTVPDLVEPIFDNSDLPIAVRKGVRSCTKHPISNFISYEKLSPTFRAFTCELKKIEIPRDIQEALRVPK